MQLMSFACFMTAPLSACVKASVQSMIANVATLVAPTGQALTLFSWFQNLVLTVLSGSVKGACMQVCIIYR